jgi:hypothetical protein
MPHVPDSVSGVTIGRGYDLKYKTPTKIKEDLIYAGLNETDATAYANAGCVVDSKGLCKPKYYGATAKTFILDNKSKLPEITPEQQRKLFEISYNEMEQVVRRISANESSVYGSVDFDGINPAILDIAIDMAFRGDYTAESRKILQSAIVSNDLQVLRARLSSPYWLTKKPPVPQDRYKRRLLYLGLGRCDASLAWLRADLLRRGTFVVEMNDNEIPDYLEMPQYYRGVYSRMMSISLIGVARSSVEKKQALVGSDIMASDKLLTSYATQLFQSCPVYKMFSIGISQTDGNKIVFSFPSGAKRAVCIDPNREADTKLKWGKQYCL